MRRRQKEKKSRKRYFFISLFNENKAYGIKKNRIKETYYIFILIEFNFLQVVERLCNLKPIEMRDDGGAEFELEMSLKDSSSKIFLYKVRCSILNLLGL